jgi:hypothetical protein
MTARAIPNIREGKNMKVQDIQFTPIFQQETLEKAKTWLSQERHRFRDTANFCIYNDSGVAEENVSKICHRGISVSAVTDRCMVASEFGWQRNKGMTHAIARPFVDYVVNQSYLERFFLERDVDWVTDNGFILSADIPAAILQNAMIISRHGYELSVEAFKKFNSLVSEGTLPDLAYLSCFGTTWSNKRPTVDTTPAQAVTAQWGHRAHPLLPLTGIRNFIHGEMGEMSGIPFYDASTHYRNNNNYVGGVKMFLPNWKPTTYDPNLDPSKDFSRGLFKIAGLPG